MLLLLKCCLQCSFVIGVGSSQCLYSALPFEFFLPVGLETPKYELEPWKSSINSSRALSTKSILEWCLRCIFFLLVVYFDSTTFTACVKFVSRLEHVLIFNWTNVFYLPTKPRSKIIFLKHCF